MFRNISEGVHIDFIKCSEPVFNAWCLCLDPQYKGPFKQSNDVDPISKNKVDFDCIYTPAEKKRIKPTKSCMDMYAINNKDAAYVTELIMGDYGRELVPVPITAYSFCDAFLVQISHDRLKYKANHLLEQIAYYMVQYPEKCYPIVKEYLGNHSYESYAKNVFHGTKCIDVEVVTAVITLMWNVPINVIYPSRGCIPFYHADRQPDVILVNNEMKHPENYFCATKPKNPNWRPIKGVDWSNQIKTYSNVKNAHTNAEKRLRIRLVNKTVSEFNEVTSQLEEMKEQLSLYRDQVKSMEAKIQHWAVNVGKMEGKQGVLRLRLMELGVDANSLTKSGPALEGFHYTTTSTVATAAPTHTTPTATVSHPPDIEDDLGVPAPLSVAQSVVSADVHTTTPLASTVDTATTASTGEKNPEIPVQPTVTSAASTILTTMSTAAGQILPLSAAQIAQIITPGSSAGGAQQIVSIAGQNVLISGSGPATVGGASVRYGKILKGTHKYFCSRCNRPFTQRESLVRHENENCPMIDATKKKRNTNVTNAQIWNFHRSST